MPEPKNKHPIKHNKCKPKKKCLVVKKQGDSLSKIAHQEPDSCDLSCKPCKPCLKVTKQGNELVELQHHENPCESSSSCESECEKQCLVVIKKGDEINKLNIGEPEHIVICDDKPCHELHVIQHCDGDACHN